MLEKARELLDELNGDMYYPTFEELKDLADKDKRKTFTLTWSLAYDNPGCEVYTISLAYIGKDGKLELETAVSYSV